MWLWYQYVPGKLPSPSVTVYLRLWPGSTCTKMLSCGTFGDTCNPWKCRLVGWSSGMPAVLTSFTLIVSPSLTRIVGPA